MNSQHTDTGANMVSNFSLNISLNSDNFVALATDDPREVEQALRDALANGWHGARVTITNAVTGDILESKLERVAHDLR